MQKVLILGGFGFIGTNLTEELINRKGYEIAIFEAEKDQILVPQLFEECELFFGDFQNTTDYEKIFKEKQIDVVIHLISTTNPSSSNKDIIFDIESNLISTIKLLNIMVQYHCSNIVFLSSGGTIYGDFGGKNRKKELDPKYPISSYGILKLTIEKYLHLYRYLHGINYLILRPSNPYGEYHKNAQQGLINVMLKKALRGEQVEIWGDGTVIRDYIYVKDLAKIIVELMEKGFQADSFNVGTGIGYSINEIIEIVRREITDFKVDYKDARKVDIPHVVLDIEKLKSKIDLNLTPIEEGIKKTVMWLKNI